MTNLLIKLFVKDHIHPEKSEVRERYGVFSSFVGVFVNLILAGLKLFVGLLSGSIAIVADAVNNLSDAGSSIVSFVSFKIASKPADREHPFGHARIEYVCSLILAFLIFYVGIELLLESVGGLTNKSGVDVNFSVATYIILTVCILFKLWLFLFYRKVANIIGSSVIKAASTDSLSDSVSTFAVLVSSIIMRFTDLWFIDGAVGLLVALLICYAGIKIILETVNSILGEAPTEDVVKAIEKKIAEFPVVLGIHDMMVHNYGPNNYIASFHAEVDGECDIYVVHDLIDNIEKQILEEMGILCTIHMDPIVTNDEKVNELKKIASDALNIVCPEASLHDFRTVIGETHTNMIFDVVIPFEVKENVYTVVDKLKHEVSLVNPNYYCVVTIDRG